MILENSDKTVKKNELQKQIKKASEFSKTAFSFVTGFYRLVQYLQGKSNLWSIFFH